MKDFVNVFYRSEREVLSNVGVCGFYITCPTFFFVKFQKYSTFLSIHKNFRARHQSSKILSKFWLRKSFLVKTVKKQCTKEFRTIKRSKSKIQKEHFLWKSFLWHEIFWTVYAVLGRLMSVFEVTFMKFMAHFNTF